MTPEKIEEAWDDIITALHDEYTGTRFTDKHVAPAEALRHEMAVMARALEMIETAGVASGKYRKFAEAELKGESK
jgi:hypothetical protein